MLKQSSHSDHVTLLLMECDWYWFSSFGLCGLLVVMWVGCCCDWGLVAVVVVVGVAVGVVRDSI